MGAEATRLAGWERQIRPVTRPTDDKRDHRCSISSGSLKPLDELLDLPYLNVLLGFIRLLGRTHVGRVRRYRKALVKNLWIGHLVPVLTVSTATRGQGLWYRM